MQCVSEMKDMWIKHLCYKKGTRKECILRLADTERNA